ncbi:MAG: phosphatase PAP2 family protein [bacterium]|nr:phosphatase PAP2 family protein [bacterium]
MLNSRSKIFWTTLFSAILILSKPINIYPQVSDNDLSEVKIPLHLQTQISYQHQSDFSLFMEDGVNLATAPFSFTSTDWLKTGALVLATGLAFSLDPKIKDQVNSQRSPSLDNATGFGEKYGSTSYAGIFAGGMYLTGKIFNNKSIATTGRMLTESILYSGLAVSILKYTVGRSRPYTNEGPVTMFTYSFQEANVSFPSGHTATAFAVSTVLANRIDNPFATVALYGLAGFTGYQRIYDNKHWFSDVFVGAAIGYFIGSSIVNSEEDRENENFWGSLDVMPSVNSSGLGLSLHMDF